MAHSHQQPYTLARSGRKGTRCSRRHRVLSVPQLPPIVRAKLPEYIEEKTAGVYGDSTTRLEQERKCDEIVVHEILPAVIQRKLKTMGEFGQFVRSYLAAGNHREVTEAHRRFFEQARSPRAAEHAVL